MHIQAVRVPPRLRLPCEPLTQGAAMHKHPELVATVHRSAESRALHVEFGVGGACLIGLLSDAEAPHARNEGVEALAGNYGWPLLTPRLLRLLAGEVSEGVLLNCACGLPDCWPLAMTVRVQGRVVVWEDFRNLRRHGRWDYRNLQPMRFSREGYFREIARLQVAYKKFPRAGARDATRLRDSTAGSCAL